MGPARAMRVSAQLSRWAHKGPREGRGGRDPATDGLTGLGWRLGQKEPGARSPLAPRPVPRSCKGLTWAGPLWSSLPAFSLLPAGFLLPRGRLREGTPTPSLQDPGPPCPLGRVGRVTPGVSETLPGSRCASRAEEDTEALGGGRAGLPQRSPWAAPWSQQGGRPAQWPGCQVPRDQDTEWAEAWQDLACRLWVSESQDCRGKLAAWESRCLCPGPGRKRGGVLAQGHQAGRPPSPVWRRAATD